MIEGGGVCSFHIHIPISHLKTFRDLVVDVASPPSEFLQGAGPPGHAQPLQASDPACGAPAADVQEMEAFVEENGNLIVDHSLRYIPRRHRHQQNVIDFLSDNFLLGSGKTFYTYCNASSIASPRVQTHIFAYKCKMPSP